MTGHKGNKFKHYKIRIFEEEKNNTNLNYNQQIMFI
jgi:hypothetical protein